MKIKHLLCFIALCLFFTPGKAQQLSVMTLRNGATVYIWEDKSKPDVFGMIAFKVGSVDDPEQYTKPSMHWIGKKRNPSMKKLSPSMTNEQH